MKYSQVFHSKKKGTKQILRDLSLIKFLGKNAEYINIQYYIKMKFKKLMDDKKFNTIPQYDMPQTMHYVDFSNQAIKKKVLFPKNGVYTTSTVETNI